MFLSLEDNMDRLQRFAAVLRRIAPALGVHTWRNAPSMIREVEQFLPQARLISLDYDLDPWEGDARETGDGLEVVKFLVQHRQVCPVIIHSSNRERSNWMAGELELAGWRYYRTAPIDENWIEQHWQRVVRRLLRKAQANDLSGGTSL
jgi:hypothetical protein